MTHEDKTALFANGLIYGLIWLLLPKDCCAQCTAGAPCQGGFLGPGLVNFAVQPGVSPPVNVNK